MIYFAVEKTNTKKYGIVGYSTPIILRRHSTQPNNNSSVCTSSSHDNLNLARSRVSHYIHCIFYVIPVRQTTLCSYRTKWDVCWKKECYHILLDEWGCSMNDTCDIPFSYNIHQVCNPLRITESIVVKFCIGGLEGEVQPEL